MKSGFSRYFAWVCLPAFALVGVGCGGSGSSNNVQPPPSQNGTVNVMVSDQSTEDWAMIGVKIISMSLNPQGGGNPVSVYTAAAGAPSLNLLQLDQLSEILGTASIPANTYTSAALTVSGNPSDITLIASADPEPGFAATPGSTISPNQIQVVGATGSAGSQTVTITVNFVSPLTVTAGQTTPMDIEFDLSHPTFIMAHIPPVNAGSIIWAVNFNGGPVRHRRIFDIRRLILREHYATVNAVINNGTLSLTKDYPVYPPTNPETAVTTSQTLSLNVDATNGTIYYDVDGKTHSTIKDFSSIASTIDNKFIRFTARYEVDGSLTAVRIWASSTFNSVWVSPEGHVLHSNAAAGLLTIQNELGLPEVVTVDANTQFFFRTPENAISDTTPIGTGPAFLANVERGFKVHVSPSDPAAAPMIADTVDIEIARYDGSISNANANNFTYTHKFRTVGDNYTFTLPYVSSSTANANGVTGFEWWNFAFPTIVDSGANAVSDFMNVTNGDANFGGTVGPLTAYGATYAIWNDPAAKNSWAAPWVVLEPTDVPFGVAATAYSNGSFAMTVPGGTNAVTVVLNTNPGSAPLIYQVDRTNGIITISPVDISTTAGQNTLLTNLVAGTPAKVFGVPQTAGSLNGYVLVYFTGTLPSSVD